MEKRISGHTGLLALIGSPVGHSGSPAMYNYSFEKLGLDYAYVAFDIKEDKVKDAIAASTLSGMVTLHPRMLKVFIAAIASLTLSSFISNATYA